MMDLIKHNALNNSKFTAFAKRILRAVGYDPMHWMRVVGTGECRKLLRDLDIASLDVLEISGGDTWKEMPHRSYTSMDYPQYDICKDILPVQFDIIIADNVWEHLVYPHRAASNVLMMLRPGGMFLNITPFLVRVHDVPVDCSRWTETGMKGLLEEAGFDPGSMKSGSWGNKSCVEANLVRWRRKGWFAPLHNEPNYPVQVWCLARKPSGNTRMPNTDS